MRAPEFNSSEINSLKSIFCCRVPANSIELICGGRDYSEPITVLPNGRTTDHNSALHSLYALFRGCDCLFWSCKRRRANRDRHGDRGQFRHSCHAPRVSLFNAKSKIISDRETATLGAESVLAVSDPAARALHPNATRRRPRVFRKPPRPIPTSHPLPTTGRR